METPEEPTAKPESGPPLMIPITVSKSRSTWNDFLEPGKTADARPVPTVKGVLDLESTTPAEAHNQAAEVRAAARARDAARAQAGPFEVPDMMTITGTPTGVKRSRIVAAAVMLTCWAGLHYQAGAENSNVTAAATVSSLPEGTYARYRPLNAAGLPITWMTQYNKRLTVMVKEEWKLLSGGQKVEGLQWLMVQGESPDDITVVGPKSELYAQVIGSEYRIAP